MKVEVSNNEVKITFCNEVWVSNFEDIINMFKEAKTDREKRYLAVILHDAPYFTKVSEVPKASKKPSTLDILEGCMHSATKFSSYYDDIEKEIDDILGPDPYTPLY